MFKWLILHDGVLSKINLEKRQLSVTTTFLWCNTNKESTIHILRDCAIARSVWQAFVSIEAWDLFLGSDYVAWISLNLTNRDHKWHKGD